MAEVVNVSVQDLTEQEEEVQESTPVTAKTPDPVHDLSHGEGEVGEVVNVSMQDLTQSKKETNVHEEEKIVAQDLAEDIEPDNGLTKETGLLNIKSLLCQIISLMYQFQKNLCSSKMPLSIPPHLKKVNKSKIVYNVFKILKAFKFCS